MKKIAYLIQAHSDPDQLNRLVFALNDRADFFIHIDKKRDISPFKEKLNLSNVFFIIDRKRVYWGGISQVKAIISKMEFCLKHGEINNTHYKKIVHISGACYPIKNNEYIHRYFEENKNVNFIRGMNITKANKEQYNYCVKKYLFFDFFFVNLLTTRIIRKILNTLVSFFFKKPNYIFKKPNDYLDIYHGSSWWALNEDVIKYFIEFKKNNDFMQYFQYSLASDEKYFHTIFFNSKFAKTNLYSGEESYDSFTSSFANLHIIDPSLTKWFDINDFDFIKDSDKIFVRKVSTKTSKTLLDKIDNKLL